jgi:hypothetical protein
VYSRAIHGVELTTAGAPKERQLLVLASASEGKIEIESAVGNCILGRPAVDDDASLHAARGPAGSESSWP